jgi:hypothetical protein
MEEMFFRVKNTAIGYYSPPLGKRCIPGFHVD